MFRIGISGVLVSGGGNGGNFRRVGRRQFIVVPPPPAPIGNEDVVVSRTNGSDDKDEYHHDHGGDAENLERPRFVSREVSEVGLTVRVLGACQVEEQYQQSGGDEMLNKDRPSVRQRSDGTLELVLELQHVPQHQLPPDHRKGPSPPGMHLDAFDEQNVAVIHARAVAQAQHDESREGGIGVHAEPDARSDHDRSERSTDIGKDDLRSQGLDLIGHAVDPSRRKRLDEPHEEHHEIDVKIDHVQEEQSRIGDVEQSRHEAERYRPAHNGPMTRRGAEGGILEDRHDALRQCEGAVYPEEE
mmetsp:Transcript_22659/g.67064  ORF Transcript_22659/g.67064 Transcript_22659/m.67064 type:complete len:300 (+) Transcript_22659:70-969(+)